MGHLYIPANTGLHAWRGKSKKHTGHFRPKGKIQLVGNDQSFHKNPREWESTDPMLAARIFVGFNVGQEPRWTINDLIPIVESIRQAQGHPPDASFLVQKGIYTSHVDGSIVHEDGAQIVILNLTGETLHVFAEEMTALAEMIATDLEQETVIVQIQSGGIDKMTFGVVPT
jgi:hypothetical protein